MRGRQRRVRQCQALGLDISSSAVTASQHGLTGTTLAEVTPSQADRRCQCRLLEGAAGRQDHSQHSRGQEAGREAGLAQEPTKGEKALAYAKKQLGDPYARAPVQTAGIARA